MDSFLNCNNFQERFNITKYPEKKNFLSRLVVFFGYSVRPDFVCLGSNLSNTDLILCANITAHDGVLSLGLILYT